MIGLLAILCDSDAVDPANPSAAGLLQRIQRARSKEVLELLRLREESHQSTLLHWAAEEGLVECVECLLLLDPSLVLETDAHGKCSTRLNINPFHYHIGKDVLEVMNVHSLTS